MSSELFLLSVMTALTIFSQPAQAAAVIGRADVTREVYVCSWLLSPFNGCSVSEHIQIPDGQTLAQCCDSWQRECKQSAILVLSLTRHYVI